MAASPGSSSSEDVALRLDEESLKKEPEEVFELLEKLGEGSYGSVHQARHRATGRIIAIKQVPVDSDLQEIIKEISIMQQCECANIVRYYGSYFKQSDLWIVMEYCAAGSVADIMRILRTTLDAQQLASVLQGTLKGLTYLHARRKIHRDVKAGNILLDGRGQAKLADFGVAGQLSDTLAKRNTVIGTPFWMAPEVIQEVRGRPAMSLKPSYIPNTSCPLPSHHPPSPRLLFPADPASHTVGHPILPCPSAQPHPHTAPPPVAGWLRCACRCVVAGHHCRGNGRGTPTPRRRASYASHLHDSHQSPARPAGACSMASPLRRFHLGLPCQGARIPLGRGRFAATPFYPWGT